ncbi:MAG: ParB/RepB/Spo0J family partition protein, partial [Gammaproteobacteria bacterium]
RDVPDRAAIAMALIENIQRENLNPLEEAQALQRLISEFDMTHQQASEAVGRSRAAVTNLLRLLELTDAVKEQVERGDLEMGHARALLALKSTAQTDAARRVVARHLSVRDTENLVRRLLKENGGATAKRPRRVDPNIRQLENELTRKLGAKVNVESGSGGKGKLIIHYTSLDELDGILSRIR